MPIKFVITRGFDFTPGSVKYIVLRGFSPHPVPPPVRTKLGGGSDGVRYGGQRDVKKGGGIR